MQNFNIISTAITFLLGLSLGGLAMFYSLREKIKLQQQANSLRRIGILEQVAQHIGKVSHVYSKYYSLVSEIGPKAERMSNKQEQELGDLSSQLVAVYEEVSIAESKLLLLGEQRLQQALKLYTGKMAQFRKQIYPGRYHNIEESSQLKKEVAQMRSQFYDILSQRYDVKL